MTASFGRGRGGSQLGGTYKLNPVKFDRDLMKRSGVAHAYWKYNQYMPDEHKILPPDPLPHMRSAPPQSSTSSTSSGPTGPAPPATFQTPAGPGQTKGAGTPPPQPAPGQQPTPFSSPPTTQTAAPAPKGTAPAANFSSPGSGGPKTVKRATRKVRLPVFNPGQAGQPNPAPKTVAQQARTQKAPNSEAETPDPSGSADISFSSQSAPSSPSTSRPSGPPAAPQFMSPGMAAGLLGGPDRSAQRSSEHQSPSPQDTPVPQGPPDSAGEDAAGDQKFRAP